jgi:hypothetical protein
LEKKSVSFLATAPGVSAITLCTPKASAGSTLFFRRVVRWWICSMSWAGSEMPNGISNNTTAKWLPRVEGRLPSTGCNDTGIIQATSLMSVTPRSAR